MELAFGHIGTENLEGEHCLSWKIVLHVLMSWLNL